jgi:hypothetical protein
VLAVQESAMLQVENSHIGCPIIPKLILFIEPSEKLKTG